MVIKTVDQKLAQLEARLERLEGYKQEEEKPRINYTLELIAPDIDFFRDPDQIRQTMSEWLTQKKEKLVATQAKSEELSMLREKELAEKERESQKSNPRPRLPRP